MPWQDNLRVVLVRSRNSLNMGAAARAMFNFGFSKLWLVEPYELAFRKARSAAGAGEVLESAQVASGLEEALGEASLIVGVSGTEGRTQRHVRRQLPEGALAIRTHLAKRPAALVFGSEKFGLGNEDLSYCDWVLTIPTDEQCPSMNLGQAVAVCGYEIARRAKSVPSLKTPATVSAEQRDRISRRLTAVLDRSGFIFPDSRQSQKMKIRRFVNRLRLAPQDGRMLQGMLRQIQWKLEQP